VTPELSGAFHATSIRGIPLTVLLYGIHEPDEVPVVLRVRCDLCGASLSERSFRMPDYREDPAGVSRLIAQHAELDGVIARDHECRP